MNFVSRASAISDQLETIVQRISLKESASLLPPDGAGTMPMSTRSSPQR